MALLPDAALVVLLFHEPGDQQVKQLQQENAELTIALADVIGGVMS